MLPWNERVTMLSINPDAANRNDVARMAAELMEANHENERLKEALQSLYDEQNGPPLIRYQKSWEAAMDKAEQALKGGR